MSKPKIKIGYLTDKKTGGVVGPYWMVYIDGKWRFGKKTVQQITAIWDWFK